MPAFALTIFIGAFLLFQVQPLIGKYILPWFGGSPGVWTTCMLFFQLLLLGGYVYAHLVSRRLRPRTQAAVHLVLLVVALAMLPITPADSWKPTAGGEPTWQILLLLAASLGLPYLVLATTGPLMQDWFRRTAPGASPYRLYALSNVGSLLALVSYPFYFETSFTRQEQARLWSWGLVGYAICCGFCAWRVWRDSSPVAAPEKAPEPAAVPPPRTHWLLWLLLPAVASILLLAVTNKMCQDVAVIPFLWVVPLALYLLTFIISFDSPRWYSRFYYTLVLAGALVAAAYALFEGADMDIVWQVAIYSATLFAGCMVCHGELYRLRPHPRHLTAFYLMIAAGGAAGGLFVALVAPAVFDNFYELHLALGLIVTLLLAMALRDRAGMTPLQWRLLAVLLGLAAIYGAQQAMATWEVWLRPGGGWPVASGRSGMARWHWAVWLLAALGGGALLWREWRRGRPFNWHLATCGLIGVGLVGLVGALSVQIRNAARGAVLSARNFYGVLSVFEYEKGNPELHYLLLQHGRITHGL
ncbi:MAG: ferrichrome ABC transporter permease, partial [Verrucomicrobia bacterium]|nr:ferrichrome ABC transporter permease [Verrucomicrobiota bacterium]